MNPPADYSLHCTIENLKPLSTYKVLLAILSGVMLTASFPPGKLDWIAWFALVPLFKGLENESPSRAFRLGFLAGTVHYLTLIYWIVIAVGHYGNLNAFFSAATLFLLCLYLALYIGLFSCLNIQLQGSRFFLVFIPCFWVGLEYVRAHLLTGFPWCLLGYTQFKNLHIIQIADLCGVYGVSFVIVLVNGLIYRFFSRRYKTGVGGLKWEVPITALILAGIIAYGHYCLLHKLPEKSASASIKSTIIQGNIDQSVKWDPDYQTNTMLTYQRLTREAHHFKPKLIVWPETSVPFFFQDNIEHSPTVYSLAKESGAILIFGSPAYKRVGGSTRYYNRAYLIASNNQRPQFYDKVHLLPFGEYVPLKRLLFFINRLVPAAGDFASGDGIAPLNQDKLSVGILICYEAIFPGLARAHSRKGANILINITNDAWFGMTSAPYQHLCMAAFRAVENRMPMIRAANTGLSAFIGSHGKIIAQSNLFTKEVLNASVNIARPSLTFYARVGDLFAFTALIVSLIGIASCLFTRWKKGG
jgi:apolipoprotein N-acyltransferase